MKKTYIKPAFEIEEIAENFDILAGSPDPTDPTTDSDYTLGGGDGTDNRNGNGVGFDEGDALSKKNGTFFDSEW